jgi:hypothetical protein
MSGAGENGMQPMRGRYARIVMLSCVHVGAIALGASMSSSCDIGYPTVAFRCDPGGAESCPDTHFCCSDDPAAPGGALPGYAGREVPGSTTPFFSGINNALGRSGMCVNRDDIPFGSGLTEGVAAGCPVPCNPTWKVGDIEAVCGTGLSCCQTVELDEADCVIDPADGHYRPVDGSDIGTKYDNGTPVTNWSDGAHVTHQDPDGDACRVIAGNVSAEEAPNDDTWRDCVAHLTVANQRGFCMAVGAGGCPTARPDYVDACTRLEQARAGGG